LPSLMGGSADLAPSTKTTMVGIPDFSAEQPLGRNLHFGVREHAMGAILNGMALHGGVIPYGSTYLVFSDYMRPAIRLAALMKLPVIYIFTHDSVFVGEDGPTHQPVEHLTSLRAIPQLTVIRPSDANETVAALRWAVEYRDGPVALILARQNLPVLDLDAEDCAEAISRGGRILAEAKRSDPDLIMISTGSEVHIALEAQRDLESQGLSVRLVDMPCLSLFEQQGAEYKERILPSRVSARLAVEAGNPTDWYRYVGAQGEVIGVCTFGIPGSAEDVQRVFGLSSQVVAERARRLSRVGDLASKPSGV
jgi:transketolase